VATSNWTLLKIIDRICMKTGQPRPQSDLSVAEITAQPLYQDLIDLTNDVVQELVIRMWPEEAITRAIIQTEAPRSHDDEFSVTEAATTVTAATAATFLDADDEEPKNKLWMNGMNRWYIIDAFTSGTEAEIDENAVETLATVDGTIFQDRYALPSDYDRPVTDPGKFVNPRQITLVSNSEFQTRRFTSGNRLSVASLSTGGPTIATVTIDGGGSPCLELAVAPDDVYNIEILYYRRVAEIVVDAENAANAQYYKFIPPSHQSIILDAVIRELYMYQNQDPRFQIADANMRDKMAFMESAVDGAKEQTRMIPQVRGSARRLFGNRRSIKSLTSKYDLGDEFDRID